MALLLTISKSFLFSTYLVKKYHEVVYGNIYRANFKHEDIESAVFIFETTCGFEPQTLLCKPKQAPYPIWP